MPLVLISWQHGLAAGRSQPTVCNYYCYCSRTFLMVLAWYIITLHRLFDLVAYETRRLRNQYGYGIQRLFSISRGILFYPGFISNIFSAVYLTKAAGSCRFWLCLAIYFGLIVVNYTFWLRIAGSGVFLLIYWHIDIWDSRYRIINFALWNLLLWPVVYLLELCMCRATYLVAYFVATVRIW